MTNLIPGAYRNVSITDVDVPLEEGPLREHFLGRDAYRRTRWIVARHGGAAALLEVGRDDDEPLFAPITSLRVLAGPDETAEVTRPDLDVAIPSQIIRALEDAPTARCLVVKGMYGHMSFVLDPDPIRIRVLEVVPPEPAKLFDQARRILDVAEHLPPILLENDEVDLELVAPPTGDLLIPCRGAEIDMPGRKVDFLDQHPPVRDWTLLGCTRSRQIHEWFYGKEPEGVVDLCPLRLAEGRKRPLLTKCCLFEAEIQTEPGLAVVPWGASLEQVGEALAHLAREVEPHWAPA